MQNETRTVSSHIHHAFLDLGLILIVLFTMAAHARASDSAVIFMYHRFGEDEYPSTSIKLEQFEAHLAELKSGAYNVIALSDIVKALEWHTIA